MSCRDLRGLEVLRESNIEDECFLTAMTLPQKIVTYAMMTETSSQESFHSIINQIPDVREPNVYVYVCM